MTDGSEFCKTVHLCLCGLGILKYPCEVDYTGPGGFQENSDYLVCADMCTHTCVCVWNSLHIFGFVCNTRMFTRKMTFTVSLGYLQLLKCHIKKTSFYAISLNLCFYASATRILLNKPKTRKNHCTFCLAGVQNKRCNGYVNQWF